MPNMPSEMTPRRKGLSVTSRPQSRSEFSRRSMSLNVSSASELPGRRRSHRDYGSAIAEKDSGEESSGDDNSHSSAGESDFDFEAGFPLYAPSIAPSIADSANESVDEKPEVIESALKPRVSSLQPGPGFEVYNVVFSRYLDDEYRTREVRAEIEHKPISATAPDKNGSLFRWIHLKQDTMDFDAFQNTAKSLPDLTEKEIGDAIRLLQHSQRQAQKPFRTKDGPRGKVFGPQFLAKEISNDTLNTETWYFFFSLPYFCLSKYTELSISGHSNLQPTRTLLQSRDPSTSKGRDLEQAVCHLSGTLTNDCFHLTTLWCLVIKDKYILTCALHSGTELSGKLLDITQRPPSPPSVGLSNKPQLLQVVFESALYLIPIDECDSWFKFAQRFALVYNEFDDVYNVYLNGRRIESDQWHVVIRQARKHTTRTRVIVSPRKHPLHRPLHKASLGSDDPSDLAASRPSTPSKAPSSSSFTGFGKTDSIPEDEVKESPARGGPDHSEPRLKTPLLPGLSAPDPLKRSPSASVISLERYLQNFHALRWIGVKLSDRSDPLETDTSAGPSQGIPKITKPEDNRPRKSYDEKVDAYLEELHKYMQFKVGGDAQMKYRNCREKTLKDVERSVAGIARGGLDGAKVVRLKQQIVTAAKSIFPIFLPLDQKGTIVSKYWGAVHASILAPMKRNTRQIQLTLETLMRIARVSIDMQAQLSKGKGPNPTETNLPVEFIKSWFHLLICQLNLTQETISTARRKALKCESDLDAAMESVMTKFEGKPLPELRAPIPSELSAFFIHQVIQDMTGDLPSISDSYWEYFSQLESLIKKDPLNRSYQSKISAFLEELDIIHEQLKEQRTIIKNLQRGPLTLRIHEHWSAFSDRYHNLLFENSKNHISGTKESLSELQRKAHSLESSWRNYIQTNKEQQERLIYVFTIVTIVFLPISTVSSIFGMNVKDVRNMERGQWVFWAVAVPVTAIVIAGSLFGAGVLPFRRQQPIALSEVPGAAPGGSAYRLPPGLPPPPPPPPTPGRRWVRDSDGETVEEWI